MGCTGNQNERIQFCLSEKRYLTRPLSRTQLGIVIVAISPLLLVLYGGFQLAKGSASGVQKLHRKLHSPGQVDRRNMRRAKRTESWKALTDPKVLRRELRRLSDLVQQNVRMELGHTDSVLLERACVWMLMGYCESALRDLMSLELDGQLPVPAQGLVIQARWRVGDMRGMLRLLLPGFSVHPKTGVWQVPLPACSTPDCPDCGDVVANCLFAERALTPCDPYADFLERFAVRLDPLKRAASRAFHSASVDDEMAAIAGAMMLYEAALSINERAATYEPWREAQRNLLFFALAIVYNCRVYDNPHRSYLEGVVRYSLGALALPGPRTQLAVQNDAARQKQIYLAQNLFEIISGDSKHPARKACKKLAQQCLELRGNVAPPDEDSLFEPWASPFTKACW